MLSFSSRRSCVFPATATLKTKAFYLRRKNFTIMFVYDFDRLNDFLKRILQKHITPETQTWLEDAARAAAAHDMSKFNIAFVAMPRRTGKKLIEISSAQQEDLGSRRKDFNISGWTAD